MIAAVFTLSLLDCCLLCPSGCIYTVVLVCCCLVVLFLGNYCSLPLVVLVLQSNRSIILFINILNLVSIMGILDSLRLYRGKWEESGRSNFSADDINAVSSAKVVASDFGHSVCFVLKNGGMKFMPVSNTSKVSTAVGDSVDLTKCQVVTLSREGDADIQRIEING